ncbi:MAG: glycosyltransferase family 61 protein [Alphaproteobacteria bacterium]|nr:glycosyltransferase family 61 protein [Alphaproteobacteria bacterium]
MVLDYFLLSRQGEVRFDDARWAKGIAGRCFISSLGADGQTCDLALDDYPVLAKVDEACFELGTPNNWGHWIADTLPKLMVRQAFVELRDRPLVLGPLKPFHLETLELLNIDPSSHIRIGAADTPRARFEFSNLAVATPPGLVQSYAYVRQLFQPTQQASASGGPQRIYFSRSKLTPRHRVFNADEVESHLESQGFKIVRGDGLSVRETLDVIASAKIIAAPLGASLGNLVLAREDAEIIQLLPSVMRGQSRHLAFGAWLSYYTPFLERMQVIWGDFTGREQAYAAANDLQLADIPASYDLRELDQAIMLAEKRLMLKGKGLS